MLLATLAHASAQGTLEFIANLTPGQVVPPSGSTYSGSGSFQLEGTAWRYELLFGFPSPNFITTQIRGPAPMGSTGPVIFDLGEPSIAQPGPGDPGSLIYRGSFKLTQNQITDLQSGLWYAEIYTAQFPNGDIRGQIAVVPEPSTIALLGIGGFILFARVKNSFGG